ncbi:MAG TPA: DUF5320 domain-containing protein, partial [bacterium]|nr:DUF5320 domain-containing protein [bacterium]
MAFGDGTGPAGLGQMTGRGAGFCAGFNVPGYANPGAGFGGRRCFGGGRGRGVAFGGAGFGRGFRNAYGMGRGRYAAAQYADYPVQPESFQNAAAEKDYLKSEA